MNKALIMLVCLLAVVFPLMSCTTILFDGKDVLSYTEKTSFDTIAILNGAGEIAVTESNTEELSVRCFVEYDGMSKTEFSKKTDGMFLEPRFVNNILYFEALAADGMNYWQWLDTFMDVDHIKVNYEIKVPSSIKHIRIINSVGEVLVKKIEASFAIEAFVGKVVFDDVAILEHSRISVSTGTIDIDVKDIENATSILNGVEVGSITCDFPTDGYEVNNTLVDDTSFSVDSDAMFNASAIEKYRKELLQDEVQNEPAPNGLPIIGNKVGFGRIEIR